MSGPSGNARHDTPVIVAGIIVLCGFGLAAVILTTPNTESMQRLGLLFAMFGTAVAALVAALKATQSAANTNGKLDARIQAAVHRANNARRRGDEPATAAEIDELR